MIWQEFFRARPDRFGTVIADDLTRSGTLSALERIGRVPRTEADKGLAALGQNKHFPFFAAPRPLAGNFAWVATAQAVEIRVWLCQSQLLGATLVQASIGVRKTIRKGHRVGRIAIEGGKGSVELRADGVRRCHPSDLDAQRPHPSLHTAGQTRGLEPGTKSYLLRHLPPLPPESQPAPARELRPGRRLEPALRANAPPGYA